MRLVVAPVSSLVRQLTSPGRLQAYALSEELDQWLLFDDTNIRFIGGWREVAASMRDSRLQPSLLFYERLCT